MSMHLYIYIHVHAQKKCNLLSKVEMVELSSLYFYIKWILLIVTFYFIKHIYFIIKQESQWKFLNV
jgi:hypothetical protein